MSEDKNGRKREQSETLQQKQNNKKPKQVFPYGNYKSYYNYRVINLFLFFLYFNKLLQTLHAFTILCFFLDW
jgi:hypothetical protein